ncbi:MAG: 4-alpha-glucanotransferase [Actinobacteria bacterium]|nr:4-alpha-glucanotransferase [Cyanobacteriota bacterium]MCL5771822.1 4-alpha-glucanotransferase [Actinomycetota bacterium]
MAIFDKRKSGMLLPVASLPSEFGIGDLGPNSYKFVDILKKSRQSFWEILPLNPTSTSKDNCPYATSSAFAGNTLLISPQLLYEEGLLEKSDIRKIKNIFNNRIYINYVDYKKVTKEKNKIFQKAFDNFKSTDNKKLKDDFDNFCMENGKKWLNGFTLFNALKKKLNYISWNKWPEKLKNLNITENLRKLNPDSDIYEGIKKEKFLQFIFFKQWFNLKNYCNNLGIKIIGDIPIYVDFESSDVWANPEIFKLDSDKNPTFVSGVPPDYFSKSGQLWGNPVYNWDNLKKNNYKWWINRIEYNLNLYDFVRIDHFRGFVAYWEVPAEDKNAKNGKWVKAYPEDFFNVLKQKLSIKFNNSNQQKNIYFSLPIIAENLGYITDDIEEIMKEYNFPGLKVILFAFGKDFPTGTHLPYNYDKNCIAYTGTHDNNTIKGWFLEEAKNYEKKNLLKYIGNAGEELNPNSINDVLIRLIMSSAAGLTIIPVQDILGLGSEARMNHPSTVRGNWKWRMTRKDFVIKNFKKLKEFTEIYSRI